MRYGSMYYYYYYYTKNYRYGKKKRKTFSSLCPHQSYPHCLLPYILNCIGSSKWCLVYCCKRVRLTNTLSCKGNGVRSTDTTLQYCHQAAPAPPPLSNHQPAPHDNEHKNSPCRDVDLLPSHHCKNFIRRENENGNPKIPRTNMNILRASKKKGKKRGIPRG